MGANQSTEIHVNFDRPNLFYFTGEQITGNISFQNTHDRLTLYEIYLEFIGELCCATKGAHHHLDNFGNSHLERNTEYHRIPFMDVRLSVVRPQNDQDELILHQGQYSWQFKLSLPHHLPPSLTPLTTTHPYVKYYIRVVLDQPRYKANVKQIYPLTIFPRVNLLHISDSQELVHFSHTNRRKFQLNGYLLTCGIVPSQNLSIRINLHNPKQCIIKRIEAILIQHHQVAESHRKEAIFRVDLPGLHEFSGTEFERTFNLVVPSIHLAPSYKFMAQFDHETHPVITRYELEVKVKSYGLLTDFGVKIPVIIGTELASDQQETINSIGETSLPNYDELPPSYESVVSNGTM